MKTITDALKTFYAKLGGDVSKLPSRTTSADLIEAMSDVYTDKEGTHVEVTTQVTEGTKIATVKTNNEDHDIYAPTELPSVTSSDEGKVLTVDSEGAWGAATPSGGAGVSIIDVTPTISGGESRLVLPNNMKIVDIMERMDAGEFIILRCYDDGSMGGGQAKTYYYPEGFDKTSQGEYGYLTFVHSSFFYDTVIIAETNDKNDNYFVTSQKIYQTLE